VNTTLNQPVVDTTQTTDHDRRDHPPDPSGVKRLSHRPVSLFDRAALHLGVALITWSRRHSRITPEQARAMLERERLRQEFERERERIAATQLLRRIM
jgi:hypothetical protein